MEDSFDGWELEDSCLLVALFVEDTLKSCDKTLLFGVSVLHVELGTGFEEIP